MTNSDLNPIFIFLLLLVSFHHHYSTAEPQPGKQLSFPHRSPTTLWDVASVSVIVGAIFATLLLIFIFLLLLLRRYLPSQSSKCEAAIGINPQLLKTFPIVLYSSVNKHVKEGDEGTLPCAVCLAEFDDNDTIRVLPRCDHFFHPTCIDAWLSTHVTCPVCRTNLDGGPGIESVNEFVKINEPDALVAEGAREDCLKLTEDRNVGFK
ncbi:E3 ubiquitin-protein ligase ATL6-like [Vicia villosa]|uniref:E3 ubiquitin-protein ligase ATL6-like n=1 Tax=Vicia villosa TaxID=3911 RepID=UPI00273B6DE9|nr:E3 ubiquitin-protein ligase ATL6-like [Vicia villosa]